MSYAEQGYGNKGAVGGRMASTLRRCSVPTVGVDCVMPRVPLHVSYMDLVVEPLAYYHSSAWRLLSAPTFLVISDNQNNPFFACYGRLLWDNLHLHAFAL